MWGTSATLQKLLSLEETTTMNNLVTFQIWALCVYSETHKPDIETNIKTSKYSQSIVETITFVIQKKKSQVKLFKILYICLLYSSYFKIPGPGMWILYESCLIFKWMEFHTENIHGILKQYPWPGLD